MDVIATATTGSLPSVGSLANVSAVINDFSNPSILHMVLISMVPLVIGVVSGYRESIYANWSKRIAKFRHEHIRTIEFLASTDYYQNLRADNRNNILQKAIMLRISDKKLRDYVTGGFTLMEPCDEEQDWSEKMSTTRSSEALRRLRIATMPSQGVWEEIEPGLWFMHTESDQPSGDLWERQTMFTYNLKTSQRNGEQRINAFLDDCMKTYTEILRKQEDKARYMYQLLLGMSKADDEGTKPPVFKKYKLSEDKAFDSLFFPHKKETLALVDDFLLKRGKFGVEGFPQKLGLLLHGPPGTGKTSFVKALATYTKRHIVSVPLGKITTNQELYDIMFERVFPCLGDDGVPQRLGFDEVIFLIEEVDAASDIVKSRKTRPKQESTLQRADSVVYEALTTPSKASMKAQGSADLDLGALTSQVSMQQSAAAFDGPPVLIGASEGAVDALLGGLGTESLFTPADKLDLAGLLNVMDGVVDSPGRIVIMTTNHPEKLDAALIRPGRINNRLLFTFMREQEMLEMLSLHYGALSAQDAQTLHDILVRKNEETLCDGDDSGFCITPAEVEQLCSEADELKDFFMMLRKFPDFSAVCDY